MTKNNNKFAFTLAESLLTMVILGVVVALTLPMLKHHSDEVKYVASVKKAMTSIASATGAVELAHGDATFWDFNSAATVGWYRDVVSTIPLPQDSWARYLLNGTESGTFRPSFMTADGIAWMIIDGGYPCGGGAILVDVNGPIQPNTIGIDIHGFRVGHLCGGEDDSAKMGDFGVYAMGDGLNDHNAIWACTSFVIKNKEMPWLTTPVDNCEGYLGQ